MKVSMVGEDAESKQEHSLKVPNELNYALQVPCLTMGQILSIQTRSD
jgi:hypothetical protein